MSSTKKIHKKPCSDPRYSDNWNTPKQAYEQLVPFVNKYKQDHGIQHLVIFDPFYNTHAGTTKNYLGEVFPMATIIHKNEWMDLDDPVIPDFAREANLIITNPPYSKKNKRFTTEWMVGLEIPFMSLMPMEGIMLKNMRPVLKKDGFQFIIPNGRICFEVEGKATGSAPLGTTWYCHGLNMNKTMNYL